LRVIAPFASAWKPVMPSLIPENSPTDCIHCVHTVELLLQDVKGCVWGSKISNSFAQGTQVSQSLSHIPASSGILFSQNASSQRQLPSSYAPMCTVSPHTHCGGLVAVWLDIVVKMLVNVG
jgi:hypothetical protein